MVKIKEMPYSEKYAIALDSLKFDEELFIPFVRQHLGDEAADKLQKIWQKGIKPIQDEASFEEKYEIAYGNWIHAISSTYSFIRSHMGDEGIELFKRADADAVKRKNSGPALLLLNLIRAISPGTAFSILVKQSAYQLQWFSPFSVHELTKKRAIFDIPRCKILDFPNSDDICLIGCQQSYPIWLAEQFKVKMQSDRQGNSCRCTMTPLK